MQRTICSLTILLVFFPLIHASATSIEDRLKALEARLSQLAEENASLKKQIGFDAKDIVPTYVTAAGNEQKLSIGGYLQANAEAGDAPDARFPTDSRFIIRRARITLKGSFTEKFDFLFQSDFGNNAVGGVAGYRAQITDLAITWRNYEHAQVTMGQFKTPYGYEQLLADTKTLTVERSASNDFLTLSRQIGAMVSGSILEKRVTYWAGLFNGNGVNQGHNDNDQFLYVGRLAGTAVRNNHLTLNLATNAFTTKDTGANFTGTRNGIGLDAQASMGPAGLYAEWFQTHFDRAIGPSTDARGWSLLGTWMLVPKALQAVLRYETIDPNRAAANDDTHIWTIGANYFVKGDDLKLSINYLLGDPAGPLSDQGRLLGRMQVIF